jgi:hypothetical protein
MGPANATVVCGNGLWARATDAIRTLAPPLLTLLLVLGAALGGPVTAPVWAAAELPAQTYRCDGDPLLVERHAGAVDAPAIPNLADGTAPGDVIVLHWRDRALQLPRTNNAGAPSYTDGRWWWQAVDPDHPDFAQRRGAIERYACERTD